MGRPIFPAGAYASRFASGGRVFEGNGGLPPLDETRPQEYPYAAPPSGYQAQPHVEASGVVQQDAPPQQLEQQGYDAAAQPQAYASHESVSYDPQAQTYYQVTCCACFGGVMMSVSSFVSQSFLLCLPSFLILGKYLNSQCCAPCLWLAHFVQVLPVCLVLSGVGVAVDVLYTCTT